MLDHVALTAADAIHGGDTLNYNKPPADLRICSFAGAEHFMGHRAVRPLRAVKRISGREVIVHSHCSSVSVVLLFVIESSGGGGGVLLLFSKLYNKALQLIGHGRGADGKQILL